MSFYNSTNESGKDLIDYTDANIKQDAKILAMFNHTKIPMTPYMMLEALYEADTDGVYLITSIRRSMTDLSDNFMLVKMDKKKVEVYGRPNHYWKLNN
jgi:hypothetical protein